jgi:hypothetical protein
VGPPANSDGRKAIVDQPFEEALKGRQ